MGFLDLETATSEIIQACEPGGARDVARPFIFIVGAGVSYPSIPLAAEILDRCRTKAVGYSRTGDPAGASPLDSYSHWFEQAYPNAKQRQKYVRSLIEGKPISAANFRLAHLLLSGRVANVVVTPNFDDHVSRALTLFRRQHTTCDHPSTVERIDAESNDIQIIHVHGTFWYYDCCNLKEEIRDRASALSRAMTMASKLDELLEHRSPIVIGYAGWDRDVIMSALKRRLRRALPYNLYWFCHSKEAVDALPRWLRNNRKVRLIFQTKAQANEMSRDAEAERGKEARIIPRGVPDAPLEAKQVVEHIIQELRIDAPELTRKPLTFFAESLRASLRSEREDDSGDIYSLREVIERIERAAEQEESGEEDGSVDRWTGLDKLTSPEAAVHAGLREIRDACRKSQYREVITLATRIVGTSLSKNDLLELMNATWSAARGLLDDSSHELRGYSCVVTLGDAIADGDAPNPEVATTVARALVREGITLGTLNRSDEAVAVYEEVVRRFGDASEAALREQVALALFKKGLTLGTLNPNEEEIRAYEEVVRRFEDAPEAVLRVLVAKALVNKGFALGTLNRSDEAIAVYEEVVRRFGDAAEAALREQVAQALLNKGVLLGALNPSQEEIRGYEEVVRRFGDAPEAVLRELVALALFNRGFTLGTLNRSEEEIRAYKEVVRRFDDAPEAVIRELVAKASATLSAHAAD